MGSRTLPSLLCLTLIALVVGDAGQTKITASNDKCSEYCDKTYTPHTNEEPRSGKACRQGCRFFSVLQFTSDNNETAVRQACTSTCGQSYKEEANLDACNKGCQHQAPFVSGHIEVVMDSSSPLFKQTQGLFDGVFQRMNKIQESFRDSFKNFWHSSDDDGIFGQMEKEMDSMDKMFNSMVQQTFGEEKEKEEAVTEKEMLNPIYGYGRRVAQKGNKIENGNGKKRPPPGVEFNGPSVGNTDEDGQPIIRVEMVRNLDRDEWDRANTLSSLDEKPHEPSPPVDPSTAVDPDASWLACLARRARRLSAVTRWLVCLALFLCILCMIWICLAIIRTAPRRRILYAKPEAVKVAHLGKMGDKQFLIEASPQVAGPPPPYTAQKQEEERKKPLEEQEEPQI